MSSNGTNPTPEEIHAYIQEHYSHVMTPWQLDLVKHLLIHPNEWISLNPRRNGRDTVSRVVNEAVEFLNARSGAQNKKSDPQI